jgi:DNA modification methylase
MKKQNIGASRGNTMHSQAIGPIEQVPIGSLKPFPGNARTHDDRQLAKIAGSLEAFGWMNPILADTEGCIIAGHGRWLAARQLGLSEVPVVRIHHLTPDAVRAYRIADNQLATLSGWDEDLLAIELQHLTSVELDFNIEMIGFDHPEIDLLIEPKVVGDEPLDAADEQVPGPAQVAVTALGDVWCMGHHRLLCASSLERASFELLMKGQKAQMCFQDPPYNVAVDGHVGGLGKTKHREFAMATGEMSEAEFTDFLATNLELTAACCRDGAVLDLCMDWRGLYPLQTAMRKAGLSLINLAAWVKSNGGMGSLYRSQHELVLIAKKGTAPHINNVALGKHGRYRTNVWRFAGVNSFGRGRMEQLTAHPTPKPVALVADAIRDVTNRGQIVLDSFMGSGTTLLAAERTGRIAYGMDIDPLYVDVAIRRWQQMTGEAATLERNGQAFDEVEAERTLLT